jgi:SAM-dependent methyltransferase
MQPVNLERDRGKVGQDVPKLLNLGCGFNKYVGAVNVDLYGDPDVRWDLEKTPLPFESNSFDVIIMRHVLEHIKNWWELFTDCARILKVGGELHIYVPDESSRTALSYRDHHNVFTIFSFHGCMPGITPERSGTNAWASQYQEKVPLTCYRYIQTPHKEYNWMTYWPFNHLLFFCAKHLRNFIWEQIFLFRKVDTGAVSKSI